LTAGLPKEERVFTHWEVLHYFGGTVYRYSASGTDLGLFASPSLVRADFMAFDAGGDLYVTDFILEVVRRVSPTGEDLGDFVAGFPGPAGIAFDAEGNLYVASFTSNIIEKYSTSGTDRGTFASSGPSASFLGIAFDASGNLYVANYAESSTGLVLRRDLVIIPVGAAPTAKDECKEDGWQSFDSVKNQGDCIQIVNTGK